jgi:hypothetical protein
MARSGMCQQPVALVSRPTLPLDTVWLTAELTFQPEQGPKLFRRTHPPRSVLYFTTRLRRIIFHRAIYERTYDRPGRRPIAARPGARPLGAHGPLRGRLLDVGCASRILPRQRKPFTQGLEAEGIDVSAWGGFETMQINERGIAVAVLQPG